MRFTFVFVILFVMCAAYGADETPKASRKLEGTTAQFPEKSIEKGVNATLGVLQSCSSSSASSEPAADLKKARQGDHVRMVFCKPVRVRVLDESYDVSEVVYADGVFWLRHGDKVQRCTKYHFQEWKAFEEWYRQTLPNG
jgi:hypothetical protein